MGRILLPLPDGTAALVPTLHLVEDMEAEGKSLFLVAEQLVQKTIGLAETISLLRVAYRHSDCALPAAALNDFLLAGSPIAPAVLLTEILVALLTPLHGMGAVEEAPPGTGDPVPGEALPARAGG